MRNADPHMYKVCLTCAWNVCALVGSVARVAAMMLNANALLLKWLTCVSTVRTLLGSLVRLASMMEKRCTMPMLTPTEVADLCLHCPDFGGELGQVGLHDGEEPLNANAHYYQRGCPVSPLCGIWWGAWPGWHPWWRRDAQCRCSLLQRELRWWVSRPGWPPWMSFAQCWSWRV